MINKIDKSLTKPKERDRRLKLVEIALRKGISGPMPVISRASLGTTSKTYILIDQNS
jgi:hypothetical protein